MANILAIDAGNTNIVLGLFREGGLVHHWRIHTDRRKLVDEYADLIASLLDKVDMKLEDIDKVIISNVVPSLSNLLNALSREYFGVEPFLVDIGNRLNFVIDIDDPSELGADLIAAAAAAIEKYSVPCVIIDFGTATTLTAVNRERELTGVSIAPGLNVSCEALYSYAPHLPRIPLEAPPSVIGRNTVQAMQSGIYTGYGHLISGIVEDMKTILGEDTCVIATGGLAGAFHRGKKMVDVINPDLVLEGILLIYNMNRKDS